MAAAVWASPNLPVFDAIGMHLARVSVAIQRVVARPAFRARWADTELLLLKCCALVGTVVDVVGGGGVICAWLASPGRAVAKASPGRPVAKAVFKPV